MVVKPTEWLVLRLPVPSDHLDSILAETEHGRIQRLDLEARISRELTGDDNEYEGLRATREPIDKHRRSKAWCLIENRWATEGCHPIALGDDLAHDTINVAVCDDCADKPVQCADCKERQ